MIDNAIVMLDYYRQEQQRGVIIPLLGATFTTAAALLLVFLLVLFFLFLCLPDFILAEQILQEIFTLILVLHLQSDIDTL